MDPSLCQRPIKVWEFNSAFRGSSVGLAELLHSEKWMKPFGEYFDRFDQLVQSRDRSVLDSPVPLDLSHAAAARCDLLFTICDNGTIRRFAASEASPSAVSAVFIHDHFGGAVIEDVLEKGSYRLPEALWKNRAEPATDGKASPAIV